MATLVNQNEAFTKIDPISLDQEVEYLDKFPKWLKSWILFDASADFSVPEVYEALLQFGSDHIALPMVYNAMLSAIVAHSYKHNIVDFRTIQAMVGKDLLRMLDCQQQQLMYDLAVEDYKNNIAELHKII